MSDISARSAMRRRAVAALALVCALSACAKRAEEQAATSQSWRTTTSRTVQGAGVIVAKGAPVPFTASKVSALSGWAAEDHSAALDVFVKSCARLTRRERERPLADRQGGLGRRVSGR